MRLGLNLWKDLTMCIPSGRELAEIAGLFSGVMIC